MKAVRTCVGCKSQDSQTRLMRVKAYREHYLCADAPSVHGRGCWVHEREICLTKALQTRAFARALRLSKNLDTTEIENRLKMITSQS